MLVFDRPASQHEFGLWSQVLSPTIRLQHTSKTLSFLRPFLFNMPTNNADTVTATPTVVDPAAPVKEHAEQAAEQPAVEQKVSC